MEIFFFLGGGGYLLNRILVALVLPGLPTQQGWAPTYVLLGATHYGWGSSRRSKPLFSL